MKDILARIDERQADLGITDRALSIAAEMSSDGVRNWRRRVKRGETVSASMANLVAVALVLDVPTEWLVEGRGQSIPDPEIRASKEGEFVRRLRNTLVHTPGLTLAGLAKSAGLDRSEIDELLRGGASKPTFEVAELMCKALGTTVEEFMSDRTDPEAQRILRLLSQLTVAERRQLLGYGEALLDAQDRLPPQSPQGETREPAHSLKTPSNGENVSRTNRPGKV